MPSTDNYEITKPPKFHFHLHLNAYFFDFRSMNITSFKNKYCNILLDGMFKKKRRNLNNYHECQNRVTSACKLHNLIFLCVNVQIWIALYIVWLASSGNQQFQLDGQAGKKSGWDYKVSSHSGMKFRLFIVSKKKW